MSIDIERKMLLPFEVEKGQLAQQEQNVYAVSANSGAAVCLAFSISHSRVVGVHAAEGTLYSLCLSERTKKIGCNGDLWVLPQANAGGHNAVRIGGPGEKVAERTAGGIRVTLLGEGQILTLYPDRPSWWNMVMSQWKPTGSPTPTRLSGLQ